MTIKRVIWSPSKTPYNLPSQITPSKSIIHKISRRCLFLTGHPEMSMDRYPSSSATFDSVNAENAGTFRRDLLSAVLQLQTDYLCSCTNIQYFQSKITQKHSEHIWTFTVITNERNNLFLPRVSLWWWPFSVNSYGMDCQSLRCSNALIGNVYRDWWRWNW